MGQSGPSCEEMQGTSSSSSDRWGTLASTRWPFGARPRGRVIFVLAHVSSMKTSRSGLTNGCSRCSSSRLSATIRTFFNSQTKPLQRRAERWNRQFRVQFRLQFTQRQVQLLLNELTHPIGKCRPQGRSPPLEQRRGLIKFPTLLLDTPNPRLAHIKVRCNFPSASPPVARCEHLATELFRIRFHSVGI